MHQRIFSVITLLFLLCGSIYIFWPAEMQSVVKNINDSIRKFSIKKSVPVAYEGKTMATPVVASKQDVLTVRRRKIDAVKIHGGFFATEPDKEMKEKLIKNFLNSSRDFWQSLREEQRIRYANMTPMASNLHSLWFQKEIMNNKTGKSSGNIKK